MEALFSLYKDRGLTILAVNSGQPAESIKASVDRIGITYSVVPDRDGKIARTYGVTAIPQTFFLDKNGLIRYKIFGEASEDQLKQIVLKLL